MSRLRRACWALILVASSGANVGVASADVVLDWNIVALKTTAAAPFNPPLEARNLAMVHAAMFDAVNAIGREFHPYSSGFAHPAGRRRKQPPSRPRTPSSCGSIRRSSRRWMRRTARPSISSPPALAERADCMWAKRSQRSF